LLYSLCCLDRRDDLTELTFHQAFLAALKNASTVGPEAWDRAKANLVTLFQTLLASPDLTWDQAQGITEEYRGKLIAAHAQVSRFMELSEGGGTARPGRAVPIPSGLFDGVPAAERAQRAAALKDIHTGSSVVRLVAAGKVRAARATRASGHVASRQELH
jgi:hypothetical protein